VGLLDEVMSSAIPMPCRVIHTRNKTSTKQAYGKEGEAIYSVSRQSLNYKLLDILDSFKTVHIMFNHSVIDVNADGSCKFINEQGHHVDYIFDLIIGADGAYSSTRESILKKSRTSYSRSYISHGYKELSIPAVISPDSGSAQYALDDYNGLHIWPRGEFMMIALPNPDKSFTATLFAPYEGVDGFNSIAKPTVSTTSATNDNTEAIKSYFERHFSDLTPLMPDLVQDFIDNPVGSLVTIRVDPWNVGKVVLIGDAAHAVVPFFGQGMNAAFEDGFILYSMIIDSLNISKDVNFELILESFGRSRRPATDALADLCVEHYHDMASNTASTLYQLKKKLDAFISSLSVFSGGFMPLYSMVAFTDIPYHVAVHRANKQEQWMSLIAWLFVGVFVIVIIGLIKINL
jgi:kynurenine 3-monooxygenase